MEWPVATVLITALSTIGVAVIKFVPKRNCNGLSSREAGAVLARLAAIEKRLDRIEGHLQCASK